jgi:formylglycine-generating enzyme required for sulfatase activity
MHGNVWEWCEDRCGEKSPVEDQRSPSSAPARVLRGGSWAVDAGLCRSAFRNWVDPSIRGFNFGFRVVRE